MNILIIILIVICIIFIVKYLVHDSSKLTGTVSAKSMQTIDAIIGSSSTNFTYSIWIFVDDWNYRYGDAKVIYGRMTGGTGKKEPCPSMTLGPFKNNVTVSLAVYPGLDTATTEATTETTDTTEDKYIIHNCSIANVPIQKWVNLLVSTYGRTLDIYMDGKLVSTCILPGVAKINSTAPMYVTPNGGFSGWTAKFQYWANSSDPQTAWNVYRSGYGGSVLGNMFGNYSVKVSLIENSATEASSYVI